MQIMHALYVHKNTSTDLQLDVAALNLNKLSYTSTMAVCLLKDGNKHFFVYAFKPFTQIQI